jgi:hypothetical protein
VQALLDAGDERKAKDAALTTRHHEASCRSLDRDEHPANDVRTRTQRDVPSQRQPEMMSEDAKFALGY